MLAAKGSRADPVCPFDLQESAYCKHTVQLTEVITGCWVTAFLVLSVMYTTTNNT